MATATEYTSPPAFSRSSSLSVNRSPDTASHIYPERAIRPLPKSRLKSKLSPEQASTIVYPPEPPPISPTLNLSAQETVASSNVQVTRLPNGDATHGNYLHHHPHQQQDARSHKHCTCGEEADSGEEEVEFDHPDYRYSTDTRFAGTASAKALDQVQRRLMDAARIPAKPPPPGSAASSADGYESFENMNNKKKRKIPLSATSSMHQSQLSAEMASMGISGSVDGAADEVDADGSGGVVAVQQPVTPPLSVPASAGTGISGAGRGRYGRQNGRSEHGSRRPLGSSSMNSVNGYSSRIPARGGTELKPGADTGIENTGGIISQAIKSAAEQGPFTPDKGHENASLLHSATATASTPASSKTQFTFTMESESANKMVDQAVYGTPTPAARGMNGQPVPSGAKTSNAQGTQTTPSLRSGGAQTANAVRQAPVPGVNQQQPPPPPPPQPALNQAPLPPKIKPRRRPSQEYRAAARERRLQQEYTNYHHRPSKGNMWICEFCEYEMIYGVAPVALIRQYEIKDRAERKRAAEKQRLLEKAKAKGRKGKKGGKGKGGGHNANSNLNNTGHHGAGGAAGQQHAYDPNMPLPEGDEYYDDEEYGDEYEPVGPHDDYDPQYYPPPVPAGTPQTPAGPGGGGGNGKHRAV